MWKRDQKRTKFPDHICEASETAGTKMGHWEKLKADAPPHIPLPDL